MRVSTDHPGLLLSSIAALAVLAGCTETAAEEGAMARAEGRRQCFLPRQVNGFNTESDERVYVTVGTRDIYELEIVGVCPDVDWSQRIGIRSRGSSWVCQGLDAELIVPSPSGVQYCPVTRVRQLSEAEVRAYRERPRR
jgi:hypothetical protein